jgi:phage gpG-like protein
LSDDAFTLQTKGLDGILKALKNNMSRVRVGVLGGKTIRNQVKVEGGKSVNAANKRPKGKFDVSTNAAVGAIHEFGSEKMPQRSFLRVPISEKLQERLESAGAFTPDEFSKVVKEASLVPWLHRIAIVAEKIVGDAFATGGFGKWPKWKTKGYENNTGMLLVDTQQLRNSITSEVK